MIQAKYIPKQPAAYLVQTIEIIENEPTRAELILEALEAPEWSLIVYWQDDKIIASFEYLSHCEDVEAIITEESTTASVLADLEAAFSDACDEIDRNIRDYESDSETQNTYFI